MTQESACKAQDEEEAIEARDLLDFAKNLDFERYINDMEIMTMMEQVKKRIEDLECSKLTEDKLEALRIQEKKERMSRLRDTDGLSSCEDDDPDYYTVTDDDAKSVARSLMSEGGQSIKGVHSGMPCWTL